MAFDGITVAALTHELSDQLTGGRIAKIAQPEADELLLTIKTPQGARRLCISASASLPLIYLTEENKPSPMTAPGFCMLLRKHIGNGQIVGISQPGLERIIQFTIEHLNELGDLCRKQLIVEIMGKHSNIIFCNGEGMILDSIKHVSAQMSSVREVLAKGRTYFIPDTMTKHNPLKTDEETFASALREKPSSLARLSTPALPESVRSQPKESAHLQVSNPNGQLVTFPMISCFICTVNSITIWNKSTTDASNRSSIIMEIHRKNSLHSLCPSILLIRHGNFLPFLNCCLNTTKHAARRPESGKRAQIFAT